VVYYAAIYVSCRLLVVRAADTAICVVYYAAICVSCRLLVVRAPDTAICVVYYAAICVVSSTMSTSSTSS
jgi:hypothetical protein